MSMNSLGYRLTQLVFFVPGAAILTYIGPNDLPKAARFRSAIGRRTPINFLYTFTAYAVTGWVVLLVHSTPDPEPSVTSTSVPIVDTQPVPPAPVPSPGSSPAPVLPTGHTVTSGRCASLAGAERIVCLEPKIAALDTETKKQLAARNLGVQGSVSILQQDFLSMRAARCSPSLSDSAAVPCLTGFYQDYLSNLRRTATDRTEDDTPPSSARELPLPLRAKIGANINSAAPGQVVIWGNPAMGPRGTLTFETAKPDGRGSSCRRFSFTFEGIGPAHSDTGYACATPDGRWQEVSPPGPQRLHPN